jgi:hypothetical protein
LLKQIRKVENGERPLLDLTGEEALTVTDPGTVDGVAPAGADLEAYWRGVDARRRDAAPWPAPANAAE